MIAVNICKVMNSGRAAGRSLYNQSHRLLGIKVDIRRGSIRECMTSIISSLSDKIDQTRRAITTCRTFENSSGKVASERAVAVLLADAKLRYRRPGSINIVQESLSRLDIPLLAASTSTLTNPQVPRRHILAGPSGSRRAKDASFSS